MIRIIVFAALVSGLILAPALWLAFPRPSCEQTRKSIRGTILRMAWALAVINLFAALPSLCVMIALYADSILGISIDIFVISALFAPMMRVSLAAFAIWGVLAIVLLCRDSGNGMPVGDVAATDGELRQLWLTLSLAGISLFIGGPQYLLEAPKMFASQLGCSLASQRITDGMIVGIDWCAILSAMERWGILSANPLIWFGWTAFALWTAVALVMYLIPPRPLAQTGN